MRASDPGAPPTFDTKLLDVQIDQLFRRSLLPAVTGVLIATAVAILLSQSLPHGLTVIWLSTKYTVSLTRIGVGLAYRRRPDRRDRAVWQRWYVAILAADGASWSLVYGFFAADTSPEETMLAAVLIAILFAIASFAGVMLSIHFAGNVAFTSPLLVPVAVHCVVNGTTALAMFGACGALALWMLNLSNGWRAAREYQELLRLRFELAEALDHARHQSAVKDQFLATMSHEMRTPLHGILGMVRRMQRDVLSSEQLQRLSIVERSGDHLLSIINDVLDFSSIEAGRMQLREQPYDLAQITEDATALFSQAAPSALRVELALDLPRPSWILGDGARCRQILLNLIGNAVKFTERGAVRISATVEGDRARITVADTGPGIAPHDLAHLFEPFRQADGSFARRHGGTGLGLFISRELARAMGGELTCASEPGAGATFTFTLPWRPTAAPLPMPARSGVPRLAGRVLVAEDSPLNVTVVQAALEEMGLAAQIVGDGAAAVAEHRAGAPDLVLMDCHMPGVSGFEAARQIRAEEATRGGQRTPIIAVTASALPEDRRRALDAGMDDLVAKPFSPAELGAVLARYLAPAEAADASSAPAESLDGLVDAEEAIARLAGDRALYVGLLSAFAADYGGSVRAIEELVGAEAHDDAMVRAHTLKGLAGTLGARALAEAARALERAIVDRAPRPQIDEHLATTRRALEATLAACGRFTTGAGPGS